MASQAQKAKLRETFVLFDRDADGMIPTREIGLAIRATGFNPSDAELDKLLKGKEDHMFSYDEFAKMVEPHIAGKDMAQVLQDAFKPFDRDGSGKINSAELKHVLLNLTDMGSAAETMIAEADPNNSGHIDYKSLVNMLMS